MLRLGTGVLKVTAVGTAATNYWVVYVRHARYEARSLLAVVFLTYFLDGGISINFHMCDP